MMKNYQILKIKKKIKLKMLMIKKIMKVNLKKLIKKIKN